VVTIEEAVAVEVAETAEAEVEATEVAIEEAAIEAAQEEMAHQLNSESHVYHLLVDPHHSSLLVAKTSDFH